MTVYYFLGRLLRPFMIVALYVYSYIFRTTRTRIVLKNELGEILLVRSWLSAGNWELPGGGVGRGENAESAVIRELEEEVGIILQAGAPRESFALKSRGHDEVVFIGSARKSDLPENLPNKFEIQDAGWFSPYQLPSLGSLTREIFNKIEKEA
jgi:8-oxo-dGTP pyrophosphatase MutT (NUDIX family)